jgi:class 3 adenylate cyclase
MPNIYDYREGKNRITEILDAKVEINQQNNIPSDEQFTFDNAYYAWVTSLFVDIRDSTELFSNENQVMVSKIIRAFTSEIIDILRNNDLYREIGIRGDCVYAIYATPHQDDISVILEYAIWINTFLNMLSKLLEERNFPSIKAGIGISTAQELVVKAGRKASGINSKVWIGKSVTHASKFSSLGNKNGMSPIVLGSTTYTNIIDKFIKDNGTEGKGWFEEYNDSELGKFYACDVIKNEFSNWINNGMPMGQ